MKLVAVFVALVAAHAEQIAPAGVVRGRIAETPDPRSSELRLRDSSNAVYVCTFDSGTYIERYGERIAADGLRPGDPVELVADRNASRSCYALMVRVTNQTPVVVPRTGYRARVRPPAYRPIDNWTPRGNLTYAGVVLRANPEMLILRTRDGEQRTLVLREDTRYVDSGVASELAALRPNTRVFVRAGRNLDQELEAYQVVWGRIAGP